MPLGSFKPNQQDLDLWPLDLGTEVKYPKNGPRFAANTV